jgi:RNA polymerase sigma-70 factor (ECF subfamily)
VPDLVDYLVQTTHPGTIQLDGDTASGRAYLCELIHLRDGSSHLNYTIYHDRYQRTGVVDSPSLAMLVLLESLSPEQRVVLLLRDVFDYGYPKIAAIVGKSEDNVRQLATRGQTPRPAAPAPLSNDARAARRAGTTVLSGRRARRSRRARGAARSRRGADRRRRRQDSGARTGTARATRFARTLVNWVRLAARLPGVSLRPVEVNGGPGALYLDAQQRLICVLALDIADGQITSISAIVNPGKLTHLGPVADYTSLVRPAR